MYYITRTHVNPLINLVKIYQVSNILPRLPLFVLFTLGYPLFVLYVHVYPYIIHVPQRLLVFTPIYPRLSAFAYFYS